MPNKSLIGLLRASKITEAPTQGFKNYVKGAASGVRMTDYIVLTHSLTSQNPGIAVQLPNFTSVTFTTAFTAGPKAKDIHDASYANRVTLALGTVTADGIGAPTPLFIGDANAVVTSYSVDPIGQTITATVNFRNWVHYTGAGSAPTEAGYYVTVPLQIAYAPEPHFNSPVLTASTSYTVKPYRLGQPTPWYIDSISITTSSADDVWAVVDAAGNERVVGIILKAQFMGMTYGNWWTAFNNDYIAYAPTFTYQFQKLVNGEWVNQGSLISSVGANSLPLPSTGFSGAPNDTAQFRVIAQLIAPFQSQVATSAPFTAVIPDKLRGPGGGEPV